MSYFENIVNKWSHRVKSGMPDINNFGHKLILRQILLEESWDIRSTNTLIDSLMEADEEKYRAIAPGGGAYAKIDDLPEGWKMGDDLPTSIVKYKKTDSGKFEPIGDEETPEEVPPEENPQTLSGPEDFKRPDTEEKPSEEEPRDEKTKAEKFKDKLAKDIGDHVDPDIRITDKEVRQEVEEDTKEDESLKQEIYNMLPNDLKLASTLEGSFQENALLLTALGHLYGRRSNAGFLKNNIGMVDRDQLVRNKKNLLELYDEAKAELVEKGIRKVRKNKISEDFVRKSFETLPPKLQGYLVGAGDGGKKFIGDQHFLGYIKKDGSTTTDVNDPNIKKDVNGKAEVARGNTGTKARGHLVWRIYLEQGGVCAYSGLPLDLEEMDLEHVVGLKNDDNGAPNTVDKENREHEANQVITSTRFNQIKKDKSMPNFFEDDIDPLKDKSKEDFEKLEKGIEEANELKPQTTQTALRLMGTIHYDIEGGSETISKSEYDKLPEDDRPELNLTSEGTPKVADAKFNENLTVELLETEFELENKKYSELKDTLLEGITDEKDVKSIKGLKSKLGKRIIQSLGLSGNLTSEDRRTNSVTSADNFYRAFALGMIGAPPEKRQEYKDGWSEARKFANSRDGNGNLLNGKAHGKNQKNEFIKFIKDKGLMSDEILNDKRFKKVWSS